MIIKDLYRKLKFKKLKFKLIKNFRKGDRVSLMDENQFLGEKTPFYNSPKTDKDKEDKDPKNKGKYGKLFFPEVNYFANKDFSS